MNASHRIAATIVAALMPLATAPCVMAAGNNTHPNSEFLADRHIGPPSESGKRGVKLGDFHIRNYYPVEARKGAIRFTAFAAVREEDLSEFRVLFIHRRHKIRDQIIVATRRTPLAQFDDPELRHFRRRILLQLRRTLPELALEDIYLSHYELQVEQM